jgi:arylsulfatase A-like enzyme
LRCSRKAGTLRRTGPCLNKPYNMKYLVFLLPIIFLSACLSKEQETPLRPNIIMILADDMGYGDLSCYGNDLIATPNLDKLAEGGTRFSQFYVNSPVCSPSRVSLITGQFPARWRANSYFFTRESNLERGMADYLPAEAPSLARQLQVAGYKTGHFGKWHVGGGKGIDDAPMPEEFGFDKALTDKYSMGDKLCMVGEHYDSVSALTTPGKAYWVENKHELTAMWVDTALAFIDQNKDEPFYVNLWPYDVHDPFLPAEGEPEKFAHITDNPYEQKFLAVLDHLDKEIGRFLGELEKMNVLENTIIIFTSDNGPTDWPYYYEEGYFPPGSTGPFFGRKWSLFEGGIRMPCIISWPGYVEENVWDNTTVFSAADLIPSLCKLAGAPLPEGHDLDGEDVSSAWLGQDFERTSDMYWYYVNDPCPGKEEYISPWLAVRSGDWKLLMEPDSTGLQLYNIAADPGEQQNLVSINEDKARELSGKLMNWHRTIVLH